MQQYRRGQRLPVGGFKERRLCPEYGLNRATVLGTQSSYYNYGVLFLESSYGARSVNGRVFKTPSPHYLSPKFLNREGKGGSLQTRPETIRRASYSACYTKFKLRKMLETGVEKPSSPQSLPRYGVFILLHPVIQGITQLARAPLYMCDKFFPLKILQSVFVSAVPSSMNFELVPN